MSRWYRAYPGLVTNAKLGEVALIAKIEEGCVPEYGSAMLSTLLQSPILAT